MHVGGQARPRQDDRHVLATCEATRPKLIADGMFLVGLDIVGDKLMEVNVFSPGGLGSCQKLYGVDFADAVVAALERKVEMRSHSGPHLDNVRLATL